MPCQSLPLACRSSLTHTGDPHGSPRNGSTRIDCAVSLPCLAMVTSLHGVWPTTCLGASCVLAPTMAW